MSSFGRWRRRAAIDGIAPALRGGAMWGGGIAPALRGAMWVVALLPALAACTGDDDAQAGACDPIDVSDAAAMTLPSDVDDILERRCRPCHTDPPQMFAPLPLVTWQDIHAPLPEPRDDEPVFASMARRIHDERYPMPPTTFPPLDQDELARLDEWLADCAPAAER